MKYLLGFLLVFSSTVEASKFQKNIKEIRVYSDYVKVNIGITYGTCKDSNGNEWWGWKKSNPGHQEWMSMLLMAKASNIPLTFYDMQNSCNGEVSGAIGVEGIFIE